MLCLTTSNSRNNQTNISGRNPVKMYDLCNAQMVSNAQMRRFIWKFLREVSPHVLVVVIGCSGGVAGGRTPGWGRVPGTGRLASSGMRSNEKKTKRSLAKYDYMNTFQLISFDPRPSQERARLQRCVAALPGVAAPGSEARVWQTPRFADEKCSKEINLTQNLIQFSFQTRATPEHWLGFWFGHSCLWLSATWCRRSQLWGTWSGNWEMSV